MHKKHCVKRQYAVFPCHNISQVPYMNSLFGESNASINAPWSHAYISSGTSRCPLLRIHWMYLSELAGSHPVDQGVDEPRGIREELVEEPVPLWRATAGNYRFILALHIYGEYDASVWISIVGWASGGVQERGLAWYIEVHYICLNGRCHSQGIRLSPTPRGPRKIFEINLRQLINSLYIIGISPHTLSNTLSANAAIHIAGASEFHLASQNITVTTVLQQSTIQCSIGWLVFCASAACLATALVGTFLRYSFRVPDVLGVLSLATLRNQCETVATGGSSLYGVERARHLKHVKIQLGDVRPSYCCGYIALAAPLENSVVEKTRKGRLYEWAHSLANQYSVAVRREPGSLENMCD